RPRPGAAVPTAGASTEGLGNGGVRRPGRPGAGGDAAGPAARGHARKSGPGPRLKTSRTIRPGLAIWHVPRAGPQSADVLVPAAGKSVAIQQASECYCWLRAGVSDLAIWRSSGSATLSRLGIAR